LERGDTLHARIAGGGKGDTLGNMGIHTAGCGKGYTLHVQTEGSGKKYTLHTHTRLLMVLFLLLDVEKPYVMPEKVCPTSAFLPVVSSFSPALTFRHQGSVQ
jgi:hypothetical protein